MTFFKRKEKTSDMPSLPELPSQSMLPELPPLPSLPKDSFGDSFGMQAIKNTIRESPMPEFPTHVTRLEPTELRTRELPSLPPSADFTSKPIKKTSLVRNLEPVFVKLDKFQDSLKKFEEIKDKIVSIESALRKIKEIKEKESHELEQWEIELQMIKEKVSSIDVSLFSKI